ncbi:MAG: NPCBM/NEW2 domain-containing protein [Planctomycetes bacterium]|nr:NPCBM/NEW2 domain-containing protein [Planctomycetota bacterium]
MRTRSLLGIATVLLLYGVPSDARPQDGGTVTITTVDATLEARSVEIREVSNEPTLYYQEASGEKKSLHCADVVEIGLAPLAARPAPGPDDVQIVLRTGDILTGTLGEAGDDAIRLKSSSLGETAVPFNHIDHVRFLAQRTAWPKELSRVDKDTIITGSGDRRGGTIKSISRGEIAYYNAIRRKDDKISTSEACIVQFVPFPPDPPGAPATLYSTFQLTDGSFLQGTVKKFGEGMLAFRDLYDKERSVSSSAVSAIFFKNGRVIFLSDLPPARVQENANYIRGDAPLPSDLAYPFQRDANAGDGGKLTLRGQSFRKGIGTHAASELTWSLDAGFTKFQALVGIDDYALRLSGLDVAGNVSFTVLGDGKVLSQKKGVTSKDAPFAISANIAGCKELTLRVDFGEDRSGQCDFADWALARLIR